MKITFTCKLTMTDEIEDSEVETVYPVESVVNELKEDLQDGLTEKVLLTFQIIQSALNNIRG